MFDKVVVQNIVDEFNKAKSSTMKLQKFTKKTVTIKIDGLHDEKLFHDLKNFLQDGTRLEIEMKEIKKAAKLMSAAYVSKGISPSEEIIRVLDRYYEGTTRKHECCDD